MQPNDLEDEPRHVDVRKLIDIKVDASYARTSILGFIEILRPKGDGYVNSGDESNDLGIQKVSQSSHGNTPEAPSNRRHENQNLLWPGNSLSDTVPSEQPQVQHPIQQDHSLSSLNPSMHSRASANDEYHQSLEQTEIAGPLQPQDQPLPQFQDQDITERWTLDPYYPFFDQTMLDLFPNGEMPDLSQLETELVGLDYFEPGTWNEASFGTSTAGEKV
jgi:hypothetical protein